MNQELLQIINNFETTGEIFIAGKRNIIKLFHYNNKTINVKSFKKPDLLQGFIYRFFRNSKAQRSFDFAKILESKNIGTPLPIAFHEKKSLLFLKESYYVSEHLVPDFIFRDMFDTYYEDLENILRQFAQFCFKLHENGIEFKDHSPGNTLIKEVEKGKYDFFLVDLNRMKFHQEMSFELRMKNLNRITPSKHWIQIISNEYAKLYQKPASEVFNEMWRQTELFQQKSIKKSNLKRKLGL